MSAVLMRFLRLRVSPCVRLGLLQLHKSSIFNFTLIIIRFSSKIKSFFKIFLTFLQKSFTFNVNMQNLYTRATEQMGIDTLKAFENADRRKE